jgi:hypothetical protein
MSPPKSASSGELESGDCFAIVTALLDNLGTQWAVAGALAAMRYRVDERPTNDIDLIVADAAGLVEALVGDGFDVRSYDDDGAIYLIRATTTTCVVDLLIPVTEYQGLALRRSQDNVLTAEDVIVHKLIAGRPRDIGDIRSILASGMRLDETYVEHWAEVWDVTETWNAVARPDI